MAVLAVGSTACFLGLTVGPPISTTTSADESAPVGETSSAAPELPVAGVVQFGEDFAGVRVGMTRAGVDSVWGTTFGQCRGCARETRYYTYEPFTPEGAGIEFDDDRVAAVFTLWQPLGWRSAGGLVLGSAREEMPAAYLELVRVECVGYEALVYSRRSAKTVLYVYEDVLWGFALMSESRPVCR